MGSPSVRLTQSQRLALFRMYAAGASANACGRKFHISNVTALRIVRSIDPSMIRHSGPKPWMVNGVFVNAVPVTVLSEPVRSPALPASTFIRPPSLARLMAGR